MKRKILVLSIFLILLTAFSAVSAAEDMDNQTVSMDSDFTDSVIEDDLEQSGEVIRNFTEIQAQIDEAEENDTIELEGTYHGSGKAIKVSKSLTLQGKGEGAILDARNLSGILKISADNVIIKNIKFVNGHNQYNVIGGSEYGGAINWVANGGQIIGCSFLDCHSKYDGGAVYLKGTNLNITNSVFDHCWADSSDSRGGSLFLVGDTVRIEGCVFKNFIFGTVSWPPFYIGTAIFSRAYNLKIISSNFTDYKTCSMLALQYSDNIEIMNCNFVNLTPMVNDNLNRGAIEMYSVNNVNISGCNFINTTTSTSQTVAYNGIGSGIYASYSNFVNIEKCNFIRNSAKSACIYIDYMNYTTIRDCTFSNCTVRDSIIRIGGGNNTNSFNNVFNDIKVKAITFYSPNTVIINNTFNGITSKSEPVITSGDSVNGSKIINCSYSRNNNCLSVSNQVLIIKKLSEFVGEDVTFEYSNASNYPLLYRDKATGNALFNKTCTLTVKGDMNFTESYGTGNLGRIDIADIVRNFDAGNYVLTFRTYGDDNYQETNKTISVNVKPAETSISIDDASTYITATFQFKANVLAKNAHIFDGQVQVFVDEEYIGNCTVCNDVAYVTYTTDEIGTFNVRAVYAGSRNFAPSNATAVLRVAKIPTVIEISQLSQLTYGDDVTLNANVIPEFGTAINEGIVEFLLNNKSVGSAIVVNGSATLIQANVSAGEYDVLARFIGAENYTDSNATSRLIINRMKTVITGENATFGNGDEKIIVVRLTDINGMALADKNVSVIVNSGNTIHAVTDASGKAEFNMTGLTFGIYGYEAYFNYDENYFDSYSPRYEIIVKTPTQVSINASGEVTYGDQSDFNVSVVPQGSTVNDGRVKLYINGDEANSSDVENNSAGFIYHFEKAGIFNVTATFEGSAYFEDSNTTVQVTVKRMPTALASEDQVFEKNGEKAFRFNLTDIKGVKLSKDVKINITDLNGTLIDINNIESGEYLFNVIFEGDENYEPSNSQTRTLVVRMPTSIRIADISNPLTLHMIGLNATIFDENGNVVSGMLHYFINNVEIMGNFTPSKTGKHNLAVIYEGDGNHSPSSASVSFDVGDGRQETAIASAGITMTYGDSKYIRATLKSSDGKVLSGAKVTITLNGKTEKIYTNSKGEVSLPVKEIPKNYNAKIAFAGDACFKPVSKTVKVTVKKASVKLTAKAKTFKLKVKTKKYKITLKSKSNKAISKAKVTLKVRGKTYSANTNAKGVATFKITKLTKKGTHKATVKFSAGKCYNGISKNVKIKVK